MIPWLLLIPAAGAVAYWALRPKEERPAPSLPSDEQERRFKGYVDRIESAMETLRRVSGIAKMAQRTVVLATLDAVKKVATEDIAAGKISAQYGKRLAAISDDIRKEALFTIA